MKHLPKPQILRLREYGYPLAGENWIKTTVFVQSPDQGLSVVKVVNGDTLATVYIPADVLHATETTFS